MQLAASQVGGMKPFSAHLGGDKGGKMGHGPRDGHRRPNRDHKWAIQACRLHPNPAQNQSPRTPSYQIEVVKGKIYVMSS